MGISRCGRNWDRNLPIIERLSSDVARARLLLLFRDCRVTLPAGMGGGDNGDGGETRALRTVLVAKPLAEDPLTTGLGLTNDS